MQYKRAKKAGPHTHMTTEKRQFLSSLLEVALQKMKWDADTDADDLDEDERAAFDGMRKVCLPLFSHFACKGRKYDGRGVDDP